jgi:hypothetical protein
MSSADNLDRYHDRLTPEKRAQLLRTINKSVRRMSGRYLFHAGVRGDDAVEPPGKIERRLAVPTGAVPDERGSRHKRGKVVE